ncbi:MAG: hypothetical protein CL944_01380 [Candidatus Diapherotrites archaeon]|uniref:Uncharacterized protein n=1 Tax=Candidatus Iainarchaeum sp. TaxID=3101447 RepID=A0A2D6LPJ9_9ARCH|nr:hypothetical protein [Candidatus Diapherotrites archaeon]|tara:strand:+ start:556 stop:1743 length:1188 start_codon:yes stop_codon:yes gene_type:complete
MKSRKIALIFFLLILALLVSASPIMTIKQLNEANEIEGKKQAEESSACGRQCLIDGGWDPDSGWEPNANASVACNLKCSPEPCTASCSQQFSTFNEIDACISKCVVPKIEACTAECNSYENTWDKWYLSRCICVCDSGYVPGSNGCVLEGEVPDQPPTEDPPNIGLDVPTPDELMHLFSEDGLFPDDPKFGEMDEYTKEKIKSWLGIDVDDYKAGSGEGKKAYIILNETLKPAEYNVFGNTITRNKLEILYVYKKMQYMTAFFDHIGYDLRVIDKKDSDTVFRAIADPSAGAVAYFGHAAAPTIEDQSYEEGVGNLLALARKQWYIDQGMDAREAQRKSVGEDTMGLDFYYNHTCHSADPGFENLANLLIRPSGIYYGEEGLWWAASGAGTKYIR